MIKVVFASQSTKKSLKTTRKILDAYGRRVGPKTWIAELPEKSLETIREQLRIGARKNTSVVCFKSCRTGFKLMWLVGSDARVTENGVALVRETEQENKIGEKMTKTQNLIASAVQYAALMHDVGKSLNEFQKALFPKKGKVKAQSIRHEILSALFAASSPGGAEERWDKVFSLLNDPNIKNEKMFFEQIAPKIFPINGTSGFDLAIWLISTHHKLPYIINPARSLYPKDPDRPDSTHIRDLGLWRKNNEKPTVDFSEILSLSRPLEDFLRAESVIGIDSEKLGADPVFQGAFMLARLAFMLSDHSGSGEKEEPIGNRSKKTAFANSRQSLTFHLKADYEYAKAGAKFVFDAKKILTSKRPGLSLLPEERTDLEKKSLDKRFAWQDVCADAVVSATREKDYSRKGVFVCLTSSTGSGKTRFGARLASLLNKDEPLRLCVANGLRSLTLQTGTAYTKEFPGLPPGSIETLVGDKTTRILYDSDENDNDSKNEENDCASSFDESASAAVITTKSRRYDFENFPKILRGELYDRHNQLSEEKAVLLGSPIFVSTIDYLMGATAWSSGASVLPQLRLATSDIILDEIDSYDLQDYPALTRLLYLIGLFGRRVILSSATLMPEIANVLFDSYLSGWQSRAKIMGLSQEVLTFMLSDNVESAPPIVSSLTQKEKNNNNDQNGENTNGFERLYASFCEKVAKGEKSATRKRRGDVIRVDLNEFKTLKDIHSRIYSKIHSHVLDSHEKNCVKLNDIEVSAGLIRVVRVTDCVEISRVLASDVEKFNEMGIYVKVVPYHSNLLRIVRYETEKMLDRVLSRKPGKDGLESSDFLKEAQRLGYKRAILIVVATPVAEMGRDHDYDWGILEVSSTRSFIQLAGRILRHRLINGELKTNLKVFRFPLRKIRNVIDNKGSDACYIRPGFELLQEFSDHDLDVILNKTINSVSPHDLFVAKHDSIDNMPKWERERIESYVKDHFLKLGNHDEENLVFSRLHQKNYRFRQFGKSVEVVYEKETQKFKNEGVETGIEYYDEKDRNGYYFSDMAFFEKSIEALAEKTGVNEHILLSTEIPDRYLKKETLGNFLLGVWIPNDKQP